MCELQTKVFKYDFSITAPNTYFCAFNKKHVCFITLHTINILLIYYFIYIDNYIFENNNVNV